MFGNLRKKPLGPIFQTENKRSKYLTKKFLSTQIPKRPPLTLETEKDR